MDIAIVGAGAIGGYYGARLAHGGHTVHFLARSTAAAMREAGLTVDSHLGDFSLPQPLVYSRAEDLPACDLVCVAVKATANKVVFPQLGGLVKPGGAIILLQNG
ncbi:MAG: hypothetical protein LBI84_08865, partial [Propionibacteriaceae bacterium]|nr:hypothetical protein [Propionibacteriaceae bacterium]